VHVTLMEKLISEAVHARAVYAAQMSSEN
jgi:hypothetical protein